MSNMFIYDLDGRKYLFCPKLWWDNEYKYDPDKYYRTKYGRSLRFIVIICSSCENKYCAWAQHIDQIHFDIRSIKHTGRCSFCC